MRMLIAMNAATVAMILAKNMKMFLNLEIHNARKDVIHHTKQVARRELSNGCLIFI